MVGRQREIPYHACLYTVTFYVCVAIDGVLIGEWIY
jgi:hypothetical protein